MSDIPEACLRALALTKARLKQGGYHYRVDELPKRPSRRQIALAVKLVAADVNSEHYRKQLAKLLSAEALHQLVEEMKDNAH